MENVNDILKRQLLLMKFDSGVTLKENYEKISEGKQTLINETGYGPNNWNNWIDVDFTNRTLYLNNFLEMECRQMAGKGITSSPYDELKLNAGTKFTVRDNNSLIAKNTTYQKINDMYGNVTSTNQADILYFCDKKEFMINGEQRTYWGENFNLQVQKGFDDLCNTIGNQSNTNQSNTNQSNTNQSNTNQSNNNFQFGFNPEQGKYTLDYKSNQQTQAANPETGGLGPAKQGWNIDKVIKKYSCLNGDDFAELNVMNDTYGDIVKLNLGKNRRGKSIYGKMYVQDGYIQLWDSPYTRIGGNDQYMACINNELSFQSGQNLNLTDPSTKGPQMESTNKIGKLIREKINLDVITSAGASAGDGGTGDSAPRAPRTPRPKVDVTPLVKEVQNKLKELDPTAVVSGTMDQETINKIMLQINKLVEKQNSEAEAKRKEDERVAAIQTVDNAISSHDL